MIVRVWEAQVIPRRADEFCNVLQTDAMPMVRATDGCESVELLRPIGEGDHRILVISRWRDEAALRAYAGPMWRIRPVWAEGELAYLEHPPKVAHYSPATQPLAAG